MKEVLITKRNYKKFTYEITVEENLVSIGDYIFDFVSNNLGGNPVYRCDTEYFTKLVNKEYQKPLAQRRSAKIIASDDPVLNVQGVPTL